MTSRRAWSRTWTSCSPASTSQPRQTTRSRCWSTNVLITGGAGFLGSRLASELLTAGTVSIAGGGSRPLTRVTLVDQQPAPRELTADQRVTSLCGELTELLRPGGGGHDALAAADLIVHLAAAVSAECEADFDRGLRMNVHATESLLQSCRALGTNPVFVFASSVAVFGHSPDHPLPAVVDDQTLPNPQSSYGAQKVICEHLVADYTRKGFVRGRTIRLMTVSVRPGRPNAAASGFLSGIIREPLAGQRAVSPVDPATRVALASPAKAIGALLCAAGSAAATWGGRSAVNMPALSVTVADMVAALDRVSPAAAALIEWIPDPATAAVILSWPARFRADRAASLGLTPDPDFESIIRAHLKTAT